MPVSPRTCRGRVRSAEVKVRDEQGGPAEAHAVPRPAEPQHDAHGARVLVAMHGVQFATAVRRQPAFGSQVSVVHGLLSAQLIGCLGAWLADAGAADLDAVAEVAVAARRAI